MKASGDRKNELTAETRRRGERSGDREIGKSGDREIGRRSDSCYEVKISHAACICHPERVGANATASRRTPAAPIPQHTASGSSCKTPEDFLQRLLNAISTFRAMLREIFDESAYDRFLLRTHASRSIASYRAFTRERDAAMLKKPRCC
jgi:hypothetical protein